MPSNRNLLCRSAARKNAKIQPYESIRRNESIFVHNRRTSVYTDTTVEAESSVAGEGGGGGDKTVSEKKNSRITFGEHTGRVYNSENRHFIFVPFRAVLPNTDNPPAPGAAPPAGLLPAPSLIGFTEIRARSHLRAPSRPVPQLDFH